MAGALTGQLAGLTISSQPTMSLKSFSGFRSGASVCPARATFFSTTQVARQRAPLRIQAARVAGVDIPNQKRIEFSLQYIFGIGPTTAKSILADTEIENKRTRELSEEELTILRVEVEKYTVEGDLRRFNALNIKRLKEIGCYRGRRHVMGLPVRGQKTKTNARTRKGKPKAIAGKKTLRK